MRTGRALILPGGAVRGAFQAGVVSALDAAGVRFDVIVGTSVGACNGAALLHGYGAELPAIWRENLRDLRWFDRSRLLRARSPFLISEAMRAVVRRYGDFGRIRAHATELVVTATDWETGLNVLFSSKDEAAGWTDEERVLQFLASLTIPVICSERIYIRGRRYADGGLSGGVPLEAVVARGCTEAIIVDPAPTEAEIAMSRFLRPFGTHLAAIPHPWARVAGEYLRCGLGAPPTAHPKLRVRVLAPPPSLRLRSLDFTALDTIERALAIGLEAGERLAAEMTAPLAKSA
jgi:NTE family protein